MLEFPSENTDAESTTSQNPRRNRGAPWARGAAAGARVPRARAGRAGRRGAPGTTEITRIARSDAPVASKATASSAPIDAPIVSSARWKPKLAPTSAESEESRMSASRGAVRAALPTRSRSRPARTSPQPVAAATSPRATAVSVYPAPIHGTRRRPARSEIQPERHRGRPRRLRQCPRSGRRPTQVRPA